MIGESRPREPEALRQAGMPHAALAPRRRLRNYLLDRHLQLKYTAMVLSITVVVAGVLGALAYRYSRGQTQALSIQIALQPELDPGASRDLRAWSEMQDRRVLLAIFLGIAVLALVLGFTSIVVTHKLVGPVYRLTALHREIAQGKLRLQARIRKGDELQDFFESFAHMIEALRQRQQARIARLDAVLAAMQEGSQTDVNRRALHEMREEMQAELDR